MTRTQLQEIELERELSLQEDRRLVSLLKSEKEQRLEEKRREVDERLSKLEEGSKLLYGSRWKRSLAELIGVSERTLHRWLSGESDTVPISAVRKLDSEIELHHTRLGEYLHERRKES